MNLNKKRNKVLWGVIGISVFVFLFAALLNRYDSDEYIVSWLFAISQALFVFAIFRFKAIKELQKRSKIVWRVTFSIFSAGVTITLVGVLLSEYSLFTYAAEISHIGSFIAGLGINGLISYTSNHFDFAESDEDKKHKKEKKKKNLRK